MAKKHVTVDLDRLIHDVVKCIEETTRILQDAEDLRDQQINILHGLALIIPYEQRKISSKKH